MSRPHLDLRIQFVEQMTGIANAYARCKTWSSENFGPVGEV